MTEPTPDQSAFIWATLDGLNRTPKYCLIPLRNDNNTYRQTIDAIQYIISNRLDEDLLFNVEFYNPLLALQQNSNLYAATHIRKQPVVAVEVLDNIRRTIKQGGKFTPEHLFLRVSCRNKIKQLSLRYHNRSSQSESLNNNEVMAKTRAKKDAIAVTPVTETNNPPSQESTPPPAVIQKEQPAVTAVVVKDPIDAAFVSPKALIQDDITKISAYSIITTSAEAEGLNAVMRDLNDKKKLVDKIHKQGKEPSLIVSRRWDAAKKEILDGVEDAITGAKTLLYTWDVKQREIQAEAQRKADIERRRLDEEARAESLRIGDIKNALDKFEQDLAKQIIEAPDNTALGVIWTKTLAPFVPTQESHGVFLQHANEMKIRLEKLGQACSAIITAKTSFESGLIPQTTLDQITEVSNVTIREYSYVRDSAMQQIAMAETIAVEEATVSSEAQKSQITGQQIMAQEKPMLSYRRVWRWEVQDIDAVPVTLKQPYSEQELYIKVGEKFIRAYNKIAPQLEMFILNDFKIKEWLDKENAGPTPLTNGEVVDGIAFYVEETPVMPRS